MRLFCILNGGKETASARERFLAYLPELSQRGVQADVHIAGHLAPGLAGRTQYWIQLVRALSRCDGVFIHRVPLSVPERSLLRASGRPVIFDVDDAIWHQIDPAPDGSPRRSLRYLDLIATIRLSRLIRAGNRELASFLEPLGLPVRIAPTCVPDPGPPLPRRPGPPTLGWIGHSVNFRYLTLCAPALRRLARETPDLRVAIVADRPPELPGVPVEFHPWSLESEGERIRSFDIGIMPLTDTPWARGKCGYKLLLYMSHGIPVVASPVGVNADLVRHGVNGLLARSEEEWHACLRDLLDHPERRRQLGEAGRRQIEGRYDRKTGLNTLLRDLRETFRHRGG